MVFQLVERTGVANKPPSIPGQITLVFGAVMFPAWSGGQAKVA